MAAKASEAQIQECSYNPEQIIQHPYRKCETFKNTSQPSFRAQSTDRCETTMGAEKSKGILALAMVVVCICPFRHPPEKTVLWSKKEKHAQKFSIFRRHFTLEGTPVGHFLEKLPKLIPKDGEELTDDIKQVVRFFWFIASKRIAEYSSEEVTVILDGDRETPFDLGSTLATAEIVNLKYPKVKRVKVLMVTKNSKASCCSENNLRELRKALDPNISLTCENAPWIMHEEISLYGTMYIIYNEAKKQMQKSKMSP